MTGTLHGQEQKASGIGRWGISLLILGSVVIAAWMLQSRREESASRAAFPIEEGRVVVQGLSAPTGIYRDARGIPHIQAANDADAFFGWGFAHAQDRLAQMLWLLASARGRTAEVVGPRSIEVDRWARTLGWGAIADREFEALDTRSQGLLIAYAAGVNKRLERIRAGRVAPPQALPGGRIFIEAWEPSDSLAILKLYSWALSDTIDVSLVLHEISVLLGGRGASPFFPGAGSRARISQSGVVADLGDMNRSTDSMRAATAALARVRGAIGLKGRAVGSSAWVVGGRHTKSGSPILAADSHLQPTIPSLLHLAHVQGGQFDAAGVAVPGLPVFWTGRNGRVAWASTSARAASIDLYYEALGEMDSSQYHDGIGWQPLKEKIEQIKIRGRDPEMLTVRSTEHGPLIHELLDVKEPLSIAWVGAETAINSGWVSMSRLARARNAGELLRALAKHHEPQLAVAYADRQGAGGVQVAGWFPVRALPANLVPLPGRARWYDWTGHVAFDRLPAQKLRAGRGWAIAADNTFASHGRAKEIEWLWRSGARAGRIEELLSHAVEGGKIDLRGMSVLQSDVGSHTASSVISTALEAAGPVESLPVEAREVAELLLSWDGFSGVDSVGASVYYVFVERLSAALFMHVLGQDLAERYRTLPQVDITETMLALMAAADRDDEESAIDSESLRDVTRESLRQTWLELSFRIGANRAKWRWGRLHELAFQPFGDWRGGADLEGLSNIPYGGGGSTVNTAEFTGPDSLEVRVASMFRITVDVGSPNQALTAIAPGESEHPGHPHYRDGLAGWLEGHSELLVTDPLLVKESGALQLILEPAS